MDFLYNLLSMFCRLFPSGMLFPLAQRLNCVSVEPINGKRQHVPYSIWLPMLGRWTVWTTFDQSRHGRRFRIARIEHSMPVNRCDNSRRKRRTDSQFPSGN